MLKILITSFFISFAFCDGFVRVWQDGWQAKLESPFYQRFYATASTKDNTCEVFANNKKLISGSVRKNNINLEILPINVQAKGKFDDKNNLLLRLNNKIIITSHKDISANFQIIINDGTKIIITKDNKGNLNLTSNAKILYDLLVICAFSAK